MSDEALARKNRSEAFLSARGIPVNPWLPVIESPNDEQRRPPSEIISRILGLCFICAVGEGADVAVLDRLESRYQVRRRLTPHEARLAERPTLTPIEKTDMTWRYEAIAVLLWSIGLIERLPFPNSEIQAGLLISVISAKGEADLIAESSPLPTHIVLDSADMYYRMMWAVRDALIHQRGLPAELHPLVVGQRLYALNWLTRYRHADWDDITIDS